MKIEKLCEEIIQKNYAAVFRFCKARLREDILGAEECTQEVFLLFWHKKDELELSGKIDRWLIASASRITKKYLRKKAERMSFETDGIEDISEDVHESDTCTEAFSKLTPEEYELLKSYYSMDSKSRNKLAERLGISTNTLYQRIFEIKKKVKGKIAR